MAFHNSFQYENKTASNSLYPDVSRDGYNAATDPSMLHEKFPPWQKNRNNIGPVQEARVASDPWINRPVPPTRETSSHHWGDEENNRWNKDRMSNVDGSHWPRQRSENLSNYPLRANEPSGSQEPSKWYNDLRGGQGSDPRSSGFTNRPYENTRDWDGGPRATDFTDRSRENQNWQSGSRGSNIMDNSRDVPNYWDRGSAVPVIGTRPVEYQQNWNNRPREIMEKEWELRSRGQFDSSCSEGPIRPRMPELDHDIGHIELQRSRGPDNWANRQGDNVWPSELNVPLPRNSPGNNMSRVYKERERDRMEYGTETPVQEPSINPYSPAVRESFPERGHSGGRFMEQDLMHSQNMRPTKRSYDNVERGMSPFDKGNVWSRLEPNKRKKMARAEIGNDMLAIIGRERAALNLSSNEHKLQAPDLKFSQSKQDPKTNLDLRTKIVQPFTDKKKIYRVFVHRELYKRKAILSVHSEGIEKHLISDLHEMARSGNIDALPELQFIDYNLSSKKRIVIECNNAATVKWLLDWKSPYRNLKMVFPDDAKNIATILFTVKSPTCKIHHVIVMNMLSAQNPGLETYAWHNGRKIFSKKGVGYMFKVDGHTLRYLEKNNWELFFGLEKVFVRIQDNPIS